MKRFSRRDVLKSSLLAPAAVAAHGMQPMHHAVDAVTAPVTGPLSVEGALTSPTPGAGRERLLLDFGWRFHLGHASDPLKDFGFGTAATGNFQKTGNFMPAGGIAFDDSAWKPVDLPHDWAIELPFTNDPSLQSKGFYPLGRKYPETSVGWYRRVFELSAEDAGKRLSIEFDGAYREAMVVFNGFYLGRHFGGYDPFSFDVTAFATPGQRNVLLVRVNATESDGWFYEGAGIYRHVWLVKTHPVHVKKWGTHAGTLEASGGQAKLSLLTEVCNDDENPKNTRVVSTLLNPEGTPVAKDITAPSSIDAGEEHSYRQEVTVSSPKLWSLEDRNLYKLVTEVQVDGAVVDRYETPFGIRTAKFDAEKGLLLNGAPVKLKGTCNHQDHAGLGAALPDSVQYYRVAKLQEMGCNSLRTSHNPPTPELLDACDQMGMLVFDETRMMSSNPEGLSQFENLVRRDRNHPSVFMYSMGNEEGQANTPKGVLILKAMKRVAMQHDGSRPVSLAPTGAIGTGGLAVGDVAGYNYMDPQSEEFHNKNPEKPVMGTETVSAVGTRGIYITDRDKGFVSSYDPYTTTGRASAEGWWRFTDARPWNSGGFVWTGFDYRGEPSPNGWPNISSQYGIIDTCGFPKDSFFYYQSWWTNKPVLHLFPHWNWPGYEGKTIAVWVFSNLDKVELLVNGKSQGAKEVAKDQHVAWVVPYAPGAIEARGFKGGKQVMTTKRETTGGATKLVLRPDRQEVKADGEEVAMFAVEVQDAQGRLVPVTDNEVTFRVSGSGKLVGTGNGDPTDQAPDKGDKRKAFGGLCMGLVQSAKQAGKITVEVSSMGLAPATATIDAKQTELRPQVPVWARTAPQGSGLTGLWRPARAHAAEDDESLSVISGASLVFTLQQEGGTLTGTVEGAGSNFTGGMDVPSPVIDGKIDGDNVSFKAGNSTFEGTARGDRMVLKREVNLGWARRKAPEPDPNAPAIGPAPDGSDPSIDMSWFGRTAPPLVLERVTA
ncbi:glycoside hydrolase family 2 protein [Acidobacteria bacterium AB60]|nr:glycoside hydrolase family 2 protein [Acidobacteria bacterium AB60]